MSEENCSKKEKVLVSSSISRSLPEMTEEQILLLEKKMLFMSGAGEADVLHFFMKNEFWDGWKCYWGPMLDWKIERRASYIEVSVRCVRDTSKQRKFIHACE